MRTHDNVTLKHKYIAVAYGHLPIYNLQKKIAASRYTLEV